MLEPHHAGLLSPLIYSLHADNTVVQVILVVFTGEGLKNVVSVLESIIDSMETYALYPHQVRGCHRARSG
jgi:hypothetical protein